MNKNITPFDFEPCTSCSTNHNPPSLESIKKAMKEIKELPPKKKLPVYLDGEFKGFIRVRLGSNPCHFVLDCPRGFCSWMRKATYGEVVDDIMEDI